MITLDARTISADEIIEFATEFDPAPFHLSEEGGRNSMLGRLSASGWHTCCIAMRMQCDAFVLNTASRGSPGVSQCKWLALVGAGDTLRNSNCGFCKKIRLPSRHGTDCIHGRAF
ncbi:MAG: MaoC/PaaZ C-terminal domain-containing protein [Nitratireductor sp.]